MSYVLPRPPARPRVSFLEIGSGSEGVHRFVDAMRAWKRAPEEIAHVRDVALELVSRTAAYDEAGELSSLFRFVRDGVRYVKDVVGIDTLQTPTATLERLQGDCDDKALLLASLLESIGYRSRFVVTATRPGSPFNHVHVEAWSPRALGWVPMEPSVAGFPLGRTLPSYGPALRLE